MKYRDLPQSVRNYIELHSYQTGEGLDHHIIVYSNSSEHLICYLHQHDEEADMLQVLGIGTDIDNER